MGTMVYAYGVNEKELAKIKAKKVEIEFRNLHPELCKGRVVSLAINRYYRSLFYDDEVPARYGIVCELVGGHLGLDPRDIRIASEDGRIVIGVPPLYAWAMPPEMTVVTEDSVRRAFAKSFVALGGGLPAVKYHSLWMEN